MGQRGAGKSRVRGGRGTTVVGGGTRISKEETYEGGREGGGKLLSACNIHDSPPQEMGTCRTFSSLDTPSPWRYRARSPGFFTGAVLTKKRYQTFGSS